MGGIGGREFHKSVPENFGGVLFEQHSFPQTNTSDACSGEYLLGGPCFTLSGKRRRAVLVN